MEGGYTGSKSVPVLQWWTFYYHSNNLQTCKVLYGASKTRIIWLNFCRLYTTPTANIPQGSIPRTLNSPVRILWIGISILTYEERQDWVENTRPSCVKFQLPVSITCTHAGRWEMALSYVHDWRCHLLRPRCSSNYREHPHSRPVRSQE